MRIGTPRCGCVCLGFGLGCTWQPDREGGAEMPTWIPTQLLDNEFKRPSKAIRGLNLRLLEAHGVDVSPGRTTGLRSVSAEAQRSALIFLRRQCVYRSVEEILEAAYADDRLGDEVSQQNIRDLRLIQTWDGEAIADFRFRRDIYRALDRISSDLLPRMLPLL